MIKRRNVWKKRLEKYRRKDRKYMDLYSAKDFIYVILVNNDKIPIKLIIDTPFDKWNIENQKNYLKNTTNNWLNQD